MGKRLHVNGHKFPELVSPGFVRIGQRILHEPAPILTRNAPATPAVVTGTVGVHAREPPPHKARAAPALWMAVPACRGGARLPLHKRRGGIEGLEILDVQIFDLYVD